MTPHLIATDRSEQDAVQQTYEEARQAVQSVVSTYNNLGLPALSPEEFPRLFNDTDGLIFDKMTGGEGVALQGIKLDKAKAMDIVVKPDGYPGQVASVADLSTKARTGFDQSGNQRPLKFSLSAISSLFSLGEDGQVTLSEQSRRICDEAGKKYAFTEKGKALAAFLEGTVKAFNDSGVAAYLGSQESLYTRLNFPLPDLISRCIRSLSRDGRGFDYDFNGFANYDR